ncbi:hypothetical protein SAMN04488003_11564 [Loktanella fryxellensis]|uniref:DUF6998 domain-containing protein n=1 Tax=Loktanella fryxellensis TaxID=245187 RepID=A0A1H8GAQ6_9RHOB|nr:hypothetical protein [Loktanella fryxellensis]SEN40834.1 hypothetical protein SAMN04488003_11564 [Loktanella fryxellensis]
MRNNKFGYDSSNTNGVTITPPPAPLEAQYAADSIESLVSSIDQALEQTGFTQFELDEPIDNETPSSMSAPKALHTISQAQIIKSLREALSWLERELSWGVQPSSLPHLTGRIGELYAAMITRGQMALATNQLGYDIVTARGERVSVKTITSSTHVTFNQATFGLVDRILVLRLNFDGDEASIEEVLDCSAQDALKLLTVKGGKYYISTYKKSTVTPNFTKLMIVAEAKYKNETIVQYENATIIVTHMGKAHANTIAALKRIALEIGVDVLNSQGNPKNTRSLGSDIIKTLQALS